MSRNSETAYAKLNLALHVRERMPDDYHRIETVFAFCEDGDEVSAELADRLELRISGTFGACLDPSDNLVMNAAAALRNSAGWEAGAVIHLRKELPVASGIGGGSADAAAALRLLNRMWELNWRVEQLEPIARQLGADVPACLYSQPMRGEGRGDELGPIELGLSGTPVLLVNPRVELPTAEVFRGWDGYDRGASADWGHGRNDLEASATAIVPQIGSILAWLSAQQGATCVRMSGSGATCFALFESEDDRDHAEIAVPREWWRLATRVR